MKRLSTERAQTIVEFGLVMALIVIAVVVLLGIAGQGVLALLNSVQEAWPAA